MSTRRNSTRLLAILVVLAVGRLTSAAQSVDLFDGKSLDGWEYCLVKPDVKMDDVWSVRDGALVCKGQPMGCLATKKEFTNFCREGNRWFGGCPEAPVMFYFATGKPTDWLRENEKEYRRRRQESFDKDWNPLKGPPPR